VKLKVRTIHRITDICITAKLKTGGAYYTQVRIISETLRYLSYGLEPCERKSHGHFTVVILWVPLRNTARVSQFPSIPRLLMCMIRVSRHYLSGVSMKSAGTGLCQWHVT